MGCACETDRVTEPLWICWSCCWLSCSWCWILWSNGGGFWRTGEGIVTFGVESVEWFVTEPLGDWRVAEVEGGRNGWF